MIDFSALVLRPAMAVFGRPITVTPTKSQPAAAPYPAVGVFRAQAIDLAMEDGQLVTTTKYTLGIRRSSFTIQVRAGDQIAFDDGRVFTVDRYHPDGQGGADLTLLLNENAAAAP